MNIYAKFHRRCSTLKFTKERNSNFSVQIQIKPKSLNLYRDIMSNQSFSNFWISWT